MIARALLLLQEGSSFDRDGIFSLSDGDRRSDGLAEWSLVLLAHHRGAARARTGGRRGHDGGQTEKTDNESNRGAKRQSGPGSQRRDGMNDRATVQYWKKLNSVIKLSCLDLPPLSLCQSSRIQSE
jgi:hypothetical protein